MTFEQAAKLDDTRILLQRQCGRTCATPESLSDWAGRGDGDERSSISDGAALEFSFVNFYSYSFPSRTMSL